MMILSEKKMIEPTPKKEGIIDIVLKWKEEEESLITFFSCKTESQIKWRRT